MNILFICQPGIHKTEAGLSSIYASVRLRVLIPARFLEKSGHKLYLIPDLDNVLASIDSQIVDIDAVVISKTRNKNIPQLIRILRAKGVRVISDFCDDYIDHRFYGTRYAELTKAILSLSDVIVCSSEYLRCRLKESFPPSSFNCVISDPIEGEKGDPEFSPAASLIRLVWYGHRPNLNPLYKFVDDMLGASQSYSFSLNIVTNDVASIAVPIAIYNSKAQKKLHIEATEWTIEEQRNAIELSDAVVIPSLVDTFDSCKSPNRLLEALWSGRVAFANPIPSYTAFDSSAFIGNDLPEMILSSLDMRESVHGRIEMGQALVEKNHSQAAIGRAWESAICLDRDC